jgi:hypothetical protein
MLLANCGAPIAPPATTDDGGLATVTVPDNFSGYWMLSGANYVTSNLYMGNLVAGVSSFAAPTPLLPTALLAGIGGELNVTISPTAGEAFFQVYDCTDRYAAGVAFTFSGESGPGMVQWYAQGPASLPATQSQSTDQNGAGGVVNVPAGQFQVTAVLAATGKTIGTVNVLSVPGQATYAWFRARTH